MSDVKLFTAIYIPETPFVKGVLKPKKAKKYNFELLESRKIADTLYHFIYKKDEKQIACFYIVDDWEGPYRYLFIENNELYEEFTSQFGVAGVRGGYGECSMDIYLGDNFSSDALFKKLNTAINSGYEEGEPMPMCHFFGQQMWHDNAYLIANRIALIELREAIDTALEHGETRLGLSPSDGEGYDLFIKCVEDDFEWEALEMPYHDKEIYEPDESVEIPPYDVFKKYKRFFRK